MDADLAASLSAARRESKTEGTGETVDLGQRPSDRQALALIPEAYAASHHLLPLSVADGVVTLACADPEDGRLLREVQVVSRHSVRALRASSQEIQEAIRERYRVLDHVDQHVRAYSERMVVDAVPTPTVGLEALTKDSPVVQIVDLLIAQGLRDRASDVHIEPQQHNLRIRFRIDGMLKDTLTLPKSMAGALASRLKVMANMDIVDRHRAQDGQIRTQVEDRPIDIRVSTAETIWGEKVVLRLLDQGRT